MEAGEEGARRAMLGVRVNGVQFTVVSKVLAPPKTLTVELPPGELLSKR